MATHNPFNQDEWRELINQINSNISYLSLEIGVWSKILGCHDVSENHILDVREINQVFSLAGNYLKS